HDTASKLQSVMMALDEISELIGAEASELRTATITAQTSVREMHALLTANRALTKPPQRASVQLSELIRRAADRCSAKLEGDVSGIDIIVALPSCTHALSILFDLVAGPAESERAMTVRAERSQGRATVTFAGPVNATHPHAGELIAIAAHILARE